MGSILSKERGWSAEYRHDMTLVTLRDNLVAFSRQELVQEVGPDLGKLYRAMSTARKALVVDLSIKEVNCLYNYKGEAPVEVRAKKSEEKMVDEDLCMDRRTRNTKDVMLDIMRHLEESSCM